MVLFLKKQLRFVTSIACEINFAITSQKDRQYLNFIYLDRFSEEQTKTRPNVAFSPSGLGTTRSHEYR